MGFKKIKRQVLECIDNGFVLHEERDNIDVKNLLSTGAVSLSDIASIIGRTRGNAYSASPHHFASEVDVHLIKTTMSGKNWYIKWYFSEPNCVFISVHE